MKIEYLETVLAVYRCQNLKKAADLIPCACSTVTKHIQRVEDELQILLFERTAHNKEVKLTESGKKAIGFIETIVEQYHFMKRELHPAKKTRMKKRLIIGIDGSFMGAVALSNLASGFLLEYPDIELEIVRENYVKRKEMIFQKKLDGILLLRHWWPEDPYQDIPQEGLVAEYVGKNKVTLVSAKNNTRLTKKHYLLKELKTEKFLFGKGLQEQLEELQVGVRYKVYGNFIKACQQQGFLPMIEKVDVSAKDTMLADVKAQMISVNRGVSLCMIPDALRDNNRFKYMNIDDLPYYLKFYVIRRDEPISEPLQAFIDYMEKILD